MKMAIDSRAFLACHWVMQCGLPTFKQFDPSFGPAFEQPTLLERVVNEKSGLYFLVMRLKERVLRIIFWCVTVIYTHIYFDILFLTEFLDSFVVVVTSQIVD